MHSGSRIRGKQGSLYDSTSEPLLPSLRGSVITHTRGHTSCSTLSPGYPLPPRPPTAPPPAVRLVANSGPPYPAHPAHPAGHVDRYMPPVRLRGVHRLEQPFDRLLRADAAAQDARQQNERSTDPAPRRHGLAAKLSQAPVEHDRADEDDHGQAAAPDEAHELFEERDVDGRDTGERHGKQPQHRPQEQVHAAPALVVLGRQPHPELDLEDEDVHEHRVLAEDGGGGDQFNDVRECACGVKSGEEYG